MHDRERSCRQLRCVSAGSCRSVVRAPRTPNIPDWTGQWLRFAVKIPTQPSHDQTKPWGFGQEAPLTPEYEAILRESIADQAIGGLGNFPTTLGRPAGMPHMMMAFQPLEFVVTPEVTYVMIASYDHYRRIFTDGRDFPTQAEPTYAGYSIGKWIDEDGDGTYDVLWSRPADLRGRAPTTKRACRCMSTTSRFSSNGSIATRRIRRSCMTR